MNDIRYTHLHSLLNKKLVELQKPSKIRESSDKLPQDIVKVYYKVINNKKKYKKEEFVL